MSAVPMPRESGSHLRAAAEATVAAAPADEPGFRRSFVEAMSTLAGGVTVVTAEAPDGGLAGMTATSAVSVSADPPMLSLSMTWAGSTARVVRESGEFAVNLVCADGLAVAQRFADSGSDGFVGLALCRDPAPWLPEVVTHALQCRVVDSLHVGDHVLVVGEVVRVLAGWADDERGLVYWDRQWYLPSPREAA